MPGSLDFSERSVQILLDIVEGTSAEIGEGFFNALVSHLAHAIGVKYSWVTEWEPESRELHALSFWSNGTFVADFKYAVAETPCEPVVENRSLIHIPERVIELFPADEMLPDLGAVSYIGVPLLDTDGEVLGHLAMMDDKPIASNETILSIIRIFSARAGAELRRVRRDRDLSEHDLRHSRMFEGALDAIIEFDGELQVTNANGAARRLFPIPATDSIRITSLLTPASLGPLEQALAELKLAEGSPTALWLPEGTCGLAAGRSFPVEGTIAAYKISGKAFYCLIVRSLDERVKAENRIRLLTDETEYLRQEIEAVKGFDEIVGTSPAIRHMLADIAAVAETDASVLITGETGTGKELIARAIHRQSRRADKPLVTVNCAAISSNLQESEFFGHEKGAFTGADKRREGRFTLADGGTIFLDEVGEMSLDLQAKLLRVLEQGEYEPVGSSRTMKVDVRTIAATNRDLEKMVRDGTFRSDLLYRLNVFPIRSPALRERGDDILLLADRFAQKLSRKFGRTIEPLSDHARARLKQYAWPGNVRELQNVLERAFITSEDGKSIDLDRALSLPSSPGKLDITKGAGGEPRVLTSGELKELERSNILLALELSGGKISGANGAASILALNPNTLMSRIKSLGLTKPS